MTSRLHARAVSAAAAMSCAAMGPSLGCHDVSRFSSSGDHYEGAVVMADFVLSGIDPATRLCLELDATRLQEVPGTISTSDGRFHATPLRPIPQVWHDPLSTLSFGEGRVQNLLYVATPSADAEAAGDVFVVVSLMQSGSVEVRLLRSAPEIDAGSTSSLFGVFPLTRSGGPCSY
jgi:hypothetical protein